MKRTITTLLLFPATIWAQDASKLSINEVISLAGWMRYPIFFVLIAGVALILAEYMRIRMQMGQGKIFFDTKLSGLSPEQIQKESEKIKGGPIGKLFVNLGVHYQFTGHVDHFSTDLELFIRIMQDQFNSFKNWLTFFSDAAGALGLLGTVLGMFQTFFGGVLDKEKILNGMGIALVTTLLGLIVSLVLNFLGTFIMNLFNKKMDSIVHKVDEYKETLLRSNIPS